MATSESLLAADARLGITCNPSTDVLLLSETWPVAVSSFQSVPCGEAFQVIVEGRGALVLNFTLMQGPAGAVEAYGSALRSETSVTAHSVDADAVHVHITGLSDLARDECYGESAAEDCDAACPHLYLQLPSSKSLRSVTVGKQRVQVQVSPAAAVSAVPAQCPARTQSAPAALPGYTTYAVRVGRMLSSSPTPSFPHSAPITGMGANASFAGGVLTGTVSVPNAVFQQLAARNATYPVPWTSDDVPIPWLLPGRLIAYLDSSDTLGPGLSIPATLDGQAIPVQPVWSCRSLQRSDCFSGYWLDLSTAGVQADSSYTLSITLPALSAGVWQGVYYDNIDAIYGSV